MRTRNLPHLFLTLSILLLVSLTSSTAEARYYGHHGYHHGGHAGIHLGYRGHHGYSYRHHRRPHYYGHRYRGYHHKPYYYGRRYHHRSGYRSHHRGRRHSPLYGLLAAPAYLAYGILKTPTLIVESLTGSGYSHHSGSGHRRDDSYEDRRHDPGNTSRTENNASAETSNNYSTSSTQSQTDSAWSLLQQRHYSQALREFGARAAEQPDEGIHKIGYALAAAGSGNLDRGDWAMKRALRYDMDAFHYMELDDSMDDLLQRLIQDYQTRNDNDTVITLAMLHYLSGEKDHAKQIISTATPQLADEQTIRNLDQLFSLDSGNT